MKLDFSATNFKAKVTGWRLSIESKVNTLFPSVCDTARGIAGIAAATVDLTQLEHNDPQILARANLASEDEDSDETEQKENIQATIDEDHADKFDEHRDNDHRDNSNISGVDEDGGDDLCDHGDEREDSDGRNLNNKGDNGIGEDEDSSKAGYSGDSSDNCDNHDHNDESEEENYAPAGGSDLTEIASSSESDIGKIIEVVPAPSGSRSKGVRSG